MFRVGDLDGGLVLMIGFVKSFQRAKASACRLVASRRPNIGDLDLAPGLKLTLDLFMGLPRIFLKKISVEYFMPKPQKFQMK
jgi:hypothetical protein